MRPAVSFPSVECDASGIGVGAVLSQGGHPIDFLSKALAPRHQALAVYDKEMLAAVFAVQHWRPYLLGHHFQILTDHRTIEYFLGQRITTPAQSVIRRERTMLHQMPYQERRSSLH